MVAYVDGDQVEWMGTPPGRGALADCELVWSCSDIEHVSVLRQCALSKGKRGRLARASFAAMGLLKTA